LAQHEALCGTGGSAAVARSQRKDRKRWSLSQFVFDDRSGTLYEPLTRQPRGPSMELRKGRTLMLGAGTRWGRRSLNPHGSSATSGPLNSAASMKTHLQIRKTKKKKNGVALLIRRFRGEGFKLRAVGIQRSLAGPTGVLPVNGCVMGVNGSGGISSNMKMVLIRRFLGLCETFVVSLLHYLAREKLEKGSSEGV